MIRISTAFITFFAVLSFFNLKAQNRDLRFYLNPLPDTAMIGDTLMISGFIINDGPGAFVINKNKPLVHLQAVPLTAYGSALRKPDITKFSNAQGATVIQNGDSLPVAFPVTLSPTQMNATGGGGGLDIVIIIWPSRAYDPTDPNHGNNTDEETIYLKPYALNSFTTSLDQEAISSWRISPNPITNYFTIRMEDPQAKSMVLINELGQILDSWNMVGVKEFTTSTEGYPTGMYYLILKKQTGLSTQKLIIH